MKSRNNEHGYALLTVLMLVLLFTVLGMGLLAMNMNASKQFNVKEEQVQARHQAEMGFLHYESAVEKEINSFLMEADIEEVNKNKSAKKMCEKIIQLSNSINLDSAILDESTYYQIEIIKCGNNVLNYLNSEGELELEISSIGTSMSTSKKIIGKTILSSVISNEDEKDETKPEYPQPPQSPVKKVELENLPFSSKNYVIVTGPERLSGGTYDFKDSLVIKRAPNENIGPGNSGTNTFDVKPGSKSDLIVGKDLFIGGNLYLQNHSCIMVRGNLTILGPIYLGTQNTIIVYGNAYFREDPRLQTGSSKIYVAGKTFVNSEEKLSESSYFNSYTGFKERCDIPSGWPEPDEPSLNLYKWNLKDKLNPFYE